MRKHLLLFIAAVFTTCVAFAQNTKVVTGKLLDSQTKDPLIGATVAIKGTTKATSVALDGSFKIVVPTDGATLTFSFIGYVSKDVQVTGTKLGVITLDPTSAAMKEVVVVGTQSIAISRQTPIAVSAVGAQYIEEKGAGAEFPELLQSTPGVTVSRLGGGYGDSRINIRGFSSNNVALLINGLPVNDVEAGKIYWNDWAGLQDVTTSIQVQRGIGASTVAVPSLGGTINISTKSTEANESGTIAQSFGSYNAQKTLVSYATGLSDKGWASSFLLSRSKGDGNAEGLYYTGYSYFLNVSKVINKSNSLSFNIMGAAQNHGQRYTFNTINTYRTAPQGIRYNSDYGYLNGQLLSAEQNFYNKPLASLNHNWTIDDKSSLSTVLYGSWGNGAAVFTNSSPTSLPRTGNQFSPIDFNAVTKNNMANADGSSSTWLQNAQNNHSQYGVLSTYKRKIGQYISFLGGLDLRYYQGEHYYMVNDLLGGQYVSDPYKASNTTGDINNPNKLARTGDKINNDYTYYVQSEGVYLQTEYVKDNLSAFVALAGNNTGNRRLDYFNYLTTDPNRETKWVNFLGYQAKGGVNYNIDNQSNVFANVGYIQRSPLVATIFLNKKNDLNPDAKPEKLFTYELGYHFSSAAFSAEVNLYRSSYKDRAKAVAGPANQDGSITTANISGINEMHEGVEVFTRYRPFKGLTLNGQISIGNYYYTSNTGATQVTNDQGKSQNISALLLKGLKVGEFGSNSTGAQTTASLGADVDVMPHLKVGSNWNYRGHYYGAFDPSKLTFSGYQLYDIPDYSTLDVNAVYRFKLAGLDASLIGNVYNILNTTYISDSFDSSPSLTNVGAARLNTMGVWYGTPRTYMMTLKIKF